MEGMIEKITKWLHNIAEVILLLIMLWITFDVLGRWLFNHPIKGTVDFTELGLSMVVFLSLAYTHLHKVHVTIDFVVEKFSEKVQWIFECVINVIIAAVLSVVAWSLVMNSQRLLHSNTVTADLYLPVYLFVIIAAIGTVVFALSAVSHIVAYSKKIININKPIENKHLVSNESRIQEVVNSNES
ncbi:TRAP-type C4-dicarboxylate transport system, small permease component [Schinkia azotoformans MEV2011]|uniref:TRAP-type C4-dicarboxylate transport system, small permease component n=2 Tax=Schinkia azotoformans TaxID=1454 RepID=A0A072NW84_SCHAZ|nr:TRAP transporter small permease [Schinkia azotoformans]KEF37510.1 TRAP-type C4-dicarboxylate transport system, small permease component [Schinkia azotoformans MEV2011]MEC1697833.1 TRAP transporter small permease [Schinkia azotoformans]MEC1715988.1 TRAP transporter small permease [Schinkia azotoformans]MEC1726247.1 TRAP transporter small permease [Schinkia azotoformans]MEC1740059.1 TRAP transporter small permease [Schinkia azotoformans]